MTVNCIVVDDEPLARELLETYISRFPRLRLVASCANALEARQALHAHKADLVFLDIELPLLKGNDFLKGLYDPPAVIITTAHRKYALEGYELDVVDYLLKPITFDRFVIALEKFEKQLQPAQNPTMQRQHPDFIFVQNGSKHIKVLLSDILYIESFKDYISIHLEGGAEVSAKQSISDIQTALNDGFIRIHRSFIISKSRISAFTRSEVWIDDRVFSVGDSFRENWKAYSDVLLSGGQH